MNALHKAFCLCLVLSCSALGLFVWGLQRVFDLDQESLNSAAQAAKMMSSAESKKRELSKSRESAIEVLSFLAAWEPHLLADRRERTLASNMRAELESLAQRKLGLVTDQITTPEPQTVSIAKQQLLVQRISLRASGENLTALVSWIGEAQALFPLSRVDLCELSAGSAGNVSVQLSLSQPIPKTGQSLFGDHP